MLKQKQPGLTADCDTSAGKSFQLIICFGSVDR